MSLRIIRREIMKNVKLEILNLLVKDLEKNGNVVPNYTGYQYNDLLTVIKGLKDVGAVHVTPNCVRLLNRDKLDRKLEIVRNYYL